MIEAMVAGAILAIVLTSTAGGLALASRFIAERRVRATAETICQSHMETLLAVERDRALQAIDCQAVRYTSEVIVDARGPFVATCTLIPNQPPTPTQAYDRLVVDVTAAFDGRAIKASYATYVVNR